MERTTIQDSFFHMLVLETINYTLKKIHLDLKQKLNEIEEVGSHLGERIANHLQNNNNGGSSSHSTKMEIEDVMKFLGRDVWQFLFGKQISKLQTNRKGTFLIDSEEITFHHCLLTEKSNVTEDNLENILTFVSGIIKGVLGAFNIDCNVTASFKPKIVVNNILSLGTNIGRTGTTPVVNSPYSFTINLLNLNF